MPEVHDNEILSWQADFDGSMETFIVIFLRRPHEHPQISKRFEPVSYTHLTLPTKRIV